MPGRSRVGFVAFVRHRCARPILERSTVTPTQGLRLLALRCQHMRCSASPDGVRAAPRTRGADLQDSTCRRAHAVVLCGSDQVNIAVAAALSESGMHVFAAVRSSAEAQALRVICPSVETHIAETGDSPGHLVELAEHVDRHVGSRGLQVLVSELVPRRPYPLEFVEIELLRDYWRDHVEGLVAAINAFTPLLRSARGRVLLNGTIGGRLTLPFSGPLSIGGHAIKAIAGALRQELRPWAIDVVLIELASVRAGDGFAEFANRALADGTPNSRRLYGSRYARITQEAIAQEELSASPGEVAAELRDIAVARRPRSAYVIGRRSRALSVLSRLPTPLQDLLKRRMLG